MIDFCMTMILLVALGAAAYRYHISQVARIRRAVRKAPVVTTADALDSQLVKLVGTLRYSDQPLLLAPLSNRGCALYRVTVLEQAVPGSATGKTLVDIGRCQRSFWLEDESGRALIKPGLIRVDLELDQYQSSSLLKDLTPAQESFLNEHSQDAKDRFFGRNLQFRECILEQGDRVAVLGQARHEPNPDPPATDDTGYRDNAMRLVVCDPPDGPMLLSDNPRSFSR